MQTILGANGIIGEELAKNLHKNYTKDIRIVGRHPKKVNDSDQVFKADLLQAEQAKAAVAGTDIAYLTIGLTYTNEVWTRDWPIVLSNVIAACQNEGCKLVYFDNTYMYDQSISVQSETTPYNPSGPKGEGKAAAAVLLSTAMDNKKINAVICRAPEFYGPGKTKSFTNILIFDAIRKGEKPKVFVRDDTKRTLIYTPDASAALALIGNTPRAYGQTWHLPCDDNRMSYREMINYISKTLDRRIEYTVLRNWQLKIAALFNSNLRESKELFPRYAIDNIFDSSKFKNAFPHFKVTSYQDGIDTILAENK
jgi:nucleoside-diphosphate-sugar epimerase